MRLQLWQRGDVIIVLGLRERYCPCAISVRKERRKRRTATASHEIVRGGHSVRVKVFRQLVCEVGWARRSISPGCQR